MSQSREQGNKQSEDGSNESQRESQERLQSSGGTGKGAQGGAASGGGIQGGNANRTGGTSTGSGGGGATPSAPSTATQARRPQTQTDPWGDLLPSPEQIFTAAARIDSNSVARGETVREILDLLKARHPGSGPVDLLNLAWACYHNGSSRFTVLEGTSSNGVSFAALKDIVEIHCTLRQFCTFYAKICYNMGKETKQPPANWMRKGFKEESKHAAFDFFNGVTNAAVPNPPGGMKYTPTKEEINGHALNSTCAILEAKSSEDQVSTRGGLLARQQVQARPSAPLINWIS